jgi:hypothetical protein
MRDVVPYRLKVRYSEQMRNVIFASGEVIVDAQHVIALRDELLAQMRTQKPCTASDKDTLSD